jgi:putative pyruvate formate lyase activating enzyme
VDTLRLLDGVVDIYMPDFKFWDTEKASRFAKAPDYPERAREALLEMHRQVGDLVLDQRQIAVHGLLVRHLVMPGGLKETKEILGFLAREISSETYVNVMAQYRPCGLASQYPPIDRSLLPEEFEEALRLAKDAGLTRLDEKDWAGLLRLLGIG